MNLRLKKFYYALEKKNLDGLIVSFPANIAYLTGFSSRDAYFLISSKTKVYFTDARYIAEAKKGLKGLAIIERVNGSVFKLIAHAVKNLNLKGVGFEERNLPFAEYRKIKENLGRKVKLVPTHSLIENLRQIKSPEEVKKIKEASRITIKALKFIKNFISAGKKEIEVAAELERFIRYHGAQEAAFQMIIASGPNSSFPHHTTSQRLIKNNEAVLIDIGVDSMGYKSDLTRVFFLGKISSSIRRSYDIVRQAQDRAIKKIKPGIPVSEIDRAGRAYITQHGLGKFFIHNLGHGIGLEVHEAPHISGKENNPLQPGMVFTVEPAIYLSRRFGIRLEDMVLVTKQGCEVISGALDK